MSGKVKLLHEPVMKVRCGKGTWDAREGTECQKGLRRYIHLSILLSDVKGKEM